MGNTSLEGLTAVDVGSVGPCQDLRDEPFPVREQVFVGCLFCLTDIYRISFLPPHGHTGSRYPPSALQTVFRS